MNGFQAIELGIGIGLTMYFGTVSAAVIPQFYREIIKKKTHKAGEAVVWPEDITSSRREWMTVMVLLLACAFAHTDYATVAATLWFATLCFAINKIDIRRLVQSSDYRALNPRRPAR